MKPNLYSNTALTAQLQAGVRLSYPRWMVDVAARSVPGAADDRASMQTAIGLATRNVQENTGGPFGAVITKDLVDPAGEFLQRIVLGMGVNRVVPASDSTAHGETTAIRLAQARFGRFHLADLGGNPGLVTLFTSGEPCAQCIGNIAWAGVGRVVFASTSGDIEEITGFDEGPRHPEWVTEMEVRGMVIEGPFMREEGRLALVAYSESGAVVYNAGAVIQDPQEALLEQSLAEFLSRGRG
jgi:tRNA(Arg) A34 adenosine deaminase TadA